MPICEDIDDILADLPEPPKYSPAAENPEDAFEPDERLLEAAVDVDMKTVRQALSDGADVNIRNYPYGNTPMHLACGPRKWDAETWCQEANDRFELCQFLHKNGAELDIVNEFGFNPLDMAIAHSYVAENGGVDIVLWMQDQGATFGWFGAAIADDIETTKRMLGEGQDIDAKGRFGRSAFAEAVMHGSDAVQEFLAENGCDRTMPHPPDGRHMCYV